MDTDEILKLIVTRRSIRRYKQQAVTWDLIGTLLDAARYAPSSGNLQNWRFVIVRDFDKREAITKVCHDQHWMLSAPVHIVVYGICDICERMYGTRGSQIYTPQNCAAAIQNLMLMAHAMGLGTCWVGSFNEDALTEVVGSIENAIPYAIITVGYPDEQPKVPTREDFESRVFLESFGNKLSDPAAVHKDYNIHVKRFTKAVQDAVKKGVKPSPDSDSIVEKVRKRFFP